MVSCRSRNSHNKIKSFPFPKDSKVSWGFSGGPNVIRPEKNKGELQSLRLSSDGNGWTTEIRQRPSPECLSRPAPPLLLPNLRVLQFHVVYERGLPQLLQFQCRKKRFLYVSDLVRARFCRHKAQERSILNH